MNEMLDIWPELPIYIYAMGYLVIEKESIAALRLNHRVSRCSRQGNSNSTSTSTYAHLLPALTNLHFRGAPEYMEDLVAQTDASSLERFDITFFHQEIEILEVSELAKFVRRADKLSLVDRAQVLYMIDSISVRLSDILSGVKPKILEIDFVFPHS